MTWRSGLLHSGDPALTDTEGVTGSNPVAPTNKALTSENAGQFAVRDRHLDDAAHSQRLQPLPPRPGHDPPRGASSESGGPTRRPPRRPHRGGHRSHSAV